ncbi:MAG: DEAD/DEAH box helicase family protein [Bacteroidota bacterium]
MKFKFDHNQDYQLAAIKAVTDVFQGQPLAKGDFQLSIGRGEGIFSAQMQSEKGFGNRLLIDEEVVYQNVKAIQAAHHIQAAYPPSFKGKNFSIEMETGTGKTYVYLRSAFELNAKYGFKKFIIVVPSVAIREGVLKSIEIMASDFQALYNNVVFKHFVFDSKQLNKVKSFAMGNEFQIMLINIDSFNKKANNVIYRANDRMNGFRPVAFIQATHPIVIIDEPQNVESDKAKKALLELNPLCTLRYSATHKDRYNLVYSLDPIKAYQRRLVKKISVASTLSDDDPNTAFVKLEKVTNKKGRISCTLAFYKQFKEGAKLTKATFKQDDDLFEKSGKRAIYRDNFIVTEINTRPNMEYVKFANNIRLRLGEQNGGARTAIVKEQIRATIAAHFQKQLQVEGRGIKVLSLFFIDKVDNYRIYQESGFKLGQYAKWFEEIYTKIANDYYNLLEADILPATDVHNGYFSKDKKGKLKNTSGSTRADEDTYSLIMRDKERLLRLDNPLQFIFSHSALREGWDNPNVFQICTLNETKSSLKKRQEIGRGLRLPVNQNGERVKDEDINNLVVVANESYEDFAKNLQKEFEEDTGYVFGQLPFDAFVGIQYIDKNEEKQVLTASQSKSIWEHFKAQKYIADDGKILEQFDVAVENLTFTIPDEIEAPPLLIAQTVERYKLNNLVKKYKAPKKVKLNKKVYLDPKFEQFWKAINSKTIYSVQFDTTELIEKAAKAVQNMDKVLAPRLRTLTADLDINTSGVDAQLVMQGQAQHLPEIKYVPDILTYIQNKTELTRSTIHQILKQSGRLDDFLVHPQQFMDQSVKEIKMIMNDLIIEGIVYEKLEGIQYEMKRFEVDEHKLFYPEDRIIPSDKSVYDYVLWDSNVEKRFALDLNSSQQVKFFIKLPNWFTIDTPVGKYNPDWAILKQNGKVVYMIRETKSTKEQMKLRRAETDKIRCGKAHFECIGVDYDVALSVEDFWE